MVLPSDQSTILESLRGVLTSARPGLSTLNDYYEGDHLLQQLGLSIPPELKRFSVFLNWPRVTVDSIEQRLDVQGFRSGDGEPDDSLWDVWQYNNLDERQTFAHTDALALARSYVCVGSNDEDPEYPLVTVESPLQMIARRDPRTHRVTAALRLYSNTPSVLLENDRATLYLPNVTRWLIRQGNEWFDEVDPDVHMLGTVPVVPMVNRYRTTPRTGAVAEGVSEMRDVIPVADSASRAVTTAQLVQEVLAAPTRGVLGATKGDFVDTDGNPLPAWQAYTGALWALGNANAKTFQFDAADMANFETAVNMYARIASGLTSLPVEYFGLNTENAPSAEGQRAGETRLIKRAERKQTSFGHSWESVQRLVLRVRDGVWDPDARQMETIWRDAGTPTVAQVTDAVVKKYQAQLIDWETAQEQMGASPQAIALMKARRDADLGAAEDRSAAAIDRVVNGVQAAAEG